MRVSRDGWHKGWGTEEGRSTLVWVGRSNTREELDKTNSYSGCRFCHGVCASSPAAFGCQIPALGSWALALVLVTLWGLSGLCLQSVGHFISIPAFESSGFLSETLPPTCLVPICLCAMMRIFSGSVIVWANSPNKFFPYMQMSVLLHTYMYLCPLGSDSVEIPGSCRRDFMKNSQEMQEETIFFFL